MASTLDTPEIIRLYTVEHLTMRQIATLAGVSHPSIAKRLKRAGITAAQGEHVTRPCHHCGTPVTRRRCHAKRKRLFCSPAHYYAFLHHPNFKPSRQGQRDARVVVARWFPLQPEHVVHHHSGNERNNRPGNLAVFASQAEHMRYHRGGAALPIWDGRTRAPLPKYVPLSRRKILRGVLALDHPTLG